jgi:hypothetical protein
VRRARHFGVAKDNREPSRQAMHEELWAGVELKKETMLDFTV